MRPAPKPANEPERLSALRDTELLDSPPDARFDELTGLAALICQTPVALISFVDQFRQWFISNVGYEGVQTRRQDAFCAYTILQKGVFEVPDADQDECFVDNRLGVRFYAGAPLITKQGFALGAICVLDDHKRTLTEAQRQALLWIANQVISQIELRMLARQAVAATLAKRRFYSNISHELCTPLNAIIGFTDLVQSGVSDPQHREQLGYVMQSSQRLLSLLNNLLARTRTEPASSTTIKRGLIAASIPRVAEKERTPEDIVNNIFGSCP